MLSEKEQKERRRKTLEYVRRCRQRKKMEAEGFRRIQQAELAAMKESKSFQGSAEYKVDI